jgi:spore coat protein U-like protein
VLFPSNFRLIKGGLAFALVAATGPAALAQNATLNVTAEIQASCEVTGGTLAFGAYTSAEDATADATFSYVCTEGTNITVTLDGGQNDEGGSRAMLRSGGEDLLPYGLYKDVNHGDPWGLGENGIVVEGTSAETELVEVYGLIAAGENSPAGLYNDVVQITLNIGP